jgi:hypothetical protein
MSEIASYIQSLDLPPAPTRGAEAPEPPPDFTGAHQAVTVGSQMAEFSSAVPQSIRPAISNALLLGQLAADKATAGNPDPAAYFGAFNSVMKKIGWQVTSSGLTQQTISDQSAELHKAIIPIVSAIFGPGAAASSIIIAVLKGLQSMDPGRAMDHGLPTEEHQRQSREFRTELCRRRSGRRSDAEGRLFCPAGFG